MMRTFLTSTKVNSVALVIAFGLFSYSLTASTPAMLVGTAHSMLAQAVGTTASVPENPLNAYMKELREKETELNEREKRIGYLEERHECFAFWDGGYEFLFRLASRAICSKGPVRNNT
jgi:hypothetical protein